MAPVIHRRLMYTGDAEVVDLLTGVGSLRSITLPNQKKCMPTYSQSNFGIKMWWATTIW